MILCALINPKMRYVQTLMQPRHDRVDEHMGFTALNRANMPAHPHAHYVYRDGMKLYDRDQDILEGVASFGSMTTAQIREVYFFGLKSRTSCQNVLNRLVRNGALSRVFVNLPDNPSGGSPTGCYQIGRRSWQSAYPGTTFKEVRDQVKLMHTLLMVDTYIEALRLERAGHLAIEHHEVESQARRKFETGETHPDIALLLDMFKRQTYVKLYVEVDRSLEFEGQIQAKARRFIDAAAEAARDGKPYPRVVFVTRRGKVDRVRALKRYINGIQGVPDGLFVVCTLDEFGERIKQWSEA